MSFLKQTLLLASAAGLLLATCGTAHAAAPKAPAPSASPTPIEAKVLKETTDKMIARFGEPLRTRIETGAKGVATLWRNSDGTPAEFESFCLENFLADSVMREKTFDRIQDNMEVLNGNMLRISRAFNTPLDLDLGAPLPIDYMFAQYTPGAHLSDDLFANKTAFVIVLNFPYYTLEQKLAQGPGWSRKEWAMARLGDAFTTRIPAEVTQKISTAFLEAGNYISEYNIFMGNLRTTDSKPMFPEGLKLISHWGLRDELRGQYGVSDGLSRQEMIYRVMCRIVDQTIPKCAINSPDVLWDPVANTVVSRKDGKPMEAKPENGERYGKFLATFQAIRLLDPYVPSMPTHIQRRFEQERQIPEKEVERLLQSVVTSPLAKQVGELLSRRLGRPLRPFDIYYNSFSAGTGITEAELDKLVKSRYPTIQSFQDDMPNILQKLGFSREKAEFVAARVVLDPARGSGHAMGAASRDDKAHLRTRFPADGMTYKGFNIAIHEFGHNTEQTFSLYGVDNYLMNGVPNTAFTECMAFLFQSRDLQVLGVAKEDPQARHLAALQDFWATYEIAGTALVDMRAWRWMYAHPNATPAQLQQAVLAIARDVWNSYYAPVLGEKDCTLLAVYSHMINDGMYLPDYPLGHIINFQLERYMEGRNLGTEMERMCRQGALTPNEWMKGAVGAELSTEPLLTATTEALKAIK